jgi:hypothetical protein
VLQDSDLMAELNDRSSSAFLFLDWLFRTAVLIAHIGKLLQE